MTIVAFLHGQCAVQMLSLLEYMKFCVHALSNKNQPIVIACVLRWLRFINTSWWDAQFTQIWATVLSVKISLSYCLSRDEKLLKFFYDQVPGTTVTAWTLCGSCVTMFQGLHEHSVVLVWLCSRDYMNTQWFLCDHAPGTAWTLCGSCVTMFQGLHEHFVVLVWPCSRDYCDCMTILWFLCDMFQGLHKHFVVLVWPCSRDCMNTLWLLCDHIPGSLYPEIFHSELKTPLNCV